MFGWPVVGGVDRPLHSDWRPSAVGFGESDPPGFVNNDLEASFADHHLMVEPTEDDQVVLIGASHLHPGGHVEDLEPVAALAPVGGTPVTASHNNRL